MVNPEQLELQSKITGVTHIIVGILITILAILSLISWVVAFVTNMVSNWWAVFFYIPDLLVILVTLAAGAFALASGALFPNDQKKNIRLKLTFVYLILLGCCLIGSIVRVIFFVGPTIIDAIRTAVEGRQININLIGISLGFGLGVCLFGMCFVGIYILLGLWQFFVLRTQRTSGYAP